MGGIGDAGLRTTILVSGANGFVGQALCTALLASPGRHVRAATRGPAGDAEQLDHVAVGNVDGTTEWRQALQGVDTVVHLAARVHVMKDTEADPLSAFRSTNVAGSVNLARQAAEVGVRRLVFLSSIGVNGAETCGTPFRADDVPAPVSAYAISKRDAEVQLVDVARETGLEVVIVRAPLVYGAGAKGNFRRLLRLIRSGIPLPLGAIHNRRSLVALPNLVDLLDTCTTHPLAAHQTLMVCDGVDLSTTELVRRMAAASGTRARLLPIPQRMVRTAMGLLGMPSLGQQLCGSLQIDASATCARLGWRPPVSVDIAIRDAVQ